MFAAASARKLFVVFALLILFGISVQAKEWRGIVPVHSTRDDVRKLLGKPGHNLDFADFYELEEGDVQIRYAKARCNGGLFFDGYNVQQYTVLEITIRPAEPLFLEKLVKDFGIADVEKLKGETDECTGTTFYKDMEQGIHFGMRDGRISPLTYGASAADSFLRCSDEDYENEQ